MFSLHVYTFHTVILKKDLCNSVTAEFGSSKKFRVVRVTASQTKKAVRDSPVLVRSCFNSVVAYKLHYERFDSFGFGEGQYEAAADEWVIGWHVLWVQRTAPQRSTAV